jgi:membrane glycosyltransferase
MWLGLLLVSSLVSAIETTKKPQYFLPGLRSLFPHWPQIRAGETAVLFALTLAVLLLPKILGAVLTLRDRQMRRQFGGAARLCASMLVEQLFSMLLAPSMMLFHSTFVVQILLGKTVSWNAASRTDRGVTLREAFRRQKWHLAFAVAWGAIMLRVAPRFFWWLAPVLVGLICGVWFTAWTSRTSAGRTARRWGLFLIPEETAPPRELMALRCANLEALTASFAASAAKSATAAAGTTNGEGEPTRPPARLESALDPRPGTRS